MSFFKRYSTPQEYTSDYLINFSNIDSLSACALFQKISALLGGMSNVHQKIIGHVIKRKILYNEQFFPKKLDLNFLSFLRFVKFLFFLFSHVKRIPPIDNREYVGIDNWYTDSTSSFYGEKNIETIKKVYPVHIENFSQLNSLVMRDVLYSVITIAKLMYVTLLLYKKHHINIQSIIQEAVISSLSGLYIKKYMTYKVVISGTEDADIIKMKACGAAVIMLQNGIPNPDPSHAFYYGDIIHVMPGEKYFYDSGPHGYLGHQICYSGSLRLELNYRASDTQEYDILWCSSIIPQNMHMHHFPIESEIKTTKLINKMAEEHPELRIAFKMRSMRDFELLKEWGLYSNNIEYIPVSESTYHHIAKAKVVAAGVSSIVMEALCTGCRVAYVNLSENYGLNSGAKGLHIEFTGASSEDLYQFFQSILHKDFGDTSPYIKQTQNYGYTLLNSIQFLKTIPTNAPPVRLSR